MPTERQAAFFSYSRDDSEFALRLAEDLKAAGANVWLDQLDIAPGQRWARAVQDALNNCHRLLVILSPSSVNSANVADEFAFALEENKTVIPVLYRECKVPFQLRPFQYVDLRTDYARGLKTLLKTLGVEQQGVAASGAAISAVPKGYTCPPSPFCYTRFIDKPEEAIGRPAELDKVRLHLARGEYVSILAPRQTGKTTFLHDVRRRIPNSIYVDLEAKEYSDVSDVVASLARSAGDKRSAKTRSLAEFLEGLGEPRRVFLVDELASARVVAASILRQIRAYYTESLARQEKVIHQFVIAGSADLAALTQDDDPNVSPFNIAAVVYLEDFGMAETTEFVRRRAGEAFSSEVIGRVFEYTRGHPYLTQFLCDYLYHQPKDGIEKRLADLASFLEECGIEASVNIQSLVSHLFDSRNEPEFVLPTLKKILAGPNVAFSMSNRIIRRLQLQHGCIRNDQGMCVVRNPIYGSVLQKNIEIQSVASAPTVKAEDPSETMGDAMRRPESLLARPRLVNYSGYLCVSLTAGPTVLSLQGRNVLMAASGQTLEMRVRLMPGPDCDECAVAEPILAEGVNADAVTFEVIPDSETLEFNPPRRLATMHPGRTSDWLDFEFTLPTEPVKHALWVEVCQQNRLACSLHIDIDTRGEGS